MNSSASSDPSRALFAPHALLPTGWAGDVLLEWNEGGELVAVTPGVGAPADVASAAGAVIPGMPNLHSHAFQRAFAGLTEYRASGDDNREHRKQAPPRRSHFRTLCASHGALGCKRRPCR